MTQLRMYITRASIFSPRKATETQADYSERLAKMICGRRKSHLDEFETAIVVDKWLWGALMKRKRTEFEGDRACDEVPDL